MCNRTVYNDNASTFKKLPEKDIFVTKHVRSYKDISNRAL